MIKDEIIVNTKNRRRTTKESQITKLFDKSCIVTWSNDEKTESKIGSLFQTEDDYDRYLNYLKSGKPYPIKVEIRNDRPEENVFIGADETKLNNTISADFTSALVNYYKSNG